MLHQERVMAQSHHTAWAEQVVALTVSSTAEAEAALALVLVEPVRLMVHKMD
jgi:hypothetical protein